MCEYAFRAQRHLSDQADREWALIALSLPRSCPLGRVHPLRTASCGGLIGSGRLGNPWAIAVPSTRSIGVHGWLMPSLVMVGWGAGFRGDCSCSGGGSALEHFLTRLTRLGLPAKARV